MDIEQIIQTLIYSAATHKQKIERLEHDLARAFREIETLLASPHPSQDRKATT